jgi:hypothetical protein
MPKISGLIVPQLCHRCHDGNIRCLEPVAPSAHHHDYGRCEYEEAQNKEEPLGIVTEVTAIIFLVAFLNLPAFLDKHGIDLTDILLHLANHPFVALKILLKMLLKVILKVILKMAPKMAPKKRFLINGSKTESERILKLQRRNWLK